MADSQANVPEDEKKNLKKLLDAHMAVLEHRLGRTPTIEDLLDNLQETKDAVEVSQEGQKDPSQGESLDVEDGSDPNTEPKILHYKVYYGMNGDGDSRKPDPNTILYFESPEGKCYDIKNHDWSPGRPDVLNHLPSRPLMFDERGQDIMAALLHGVLDDEDYEALNQNSMLNEHHQKVWELNKQLNSQIESAVELEKSEEDDEIESVNENLDFVPPGDDLEEPGVNVSAEFNRVAGVVDGQDWALIDDPEELGENLVEQIVMAAMSNIDEKLQTLIAQEVHRQLVDMTQQDHLSDSEFSEYEE